MIITHETQVGTFTWTVPGELENYFQAMLLVDSGCQTAIGGIIGEILSLITAAALIQSTKPSEIINAISPHLIRAHTEQISLMTRMQLER